MRTNPLTGIAIPSRGRYFYYLYVYGGDCKVLVSMVVRLATSPLTLFFAYLKINFSTTKMNFEKPLAGDGARG